MQTQQTVIIYGGLGSAMLSLYVISFNPPDEDLEAYSAVSDGDDMWPVFLPHCCAYRLCWWMAGHGASSCFFLLFAAEMSVPQSGSGVPWQKEALAFLLGPVLPWSAEWSLSVNFSTLWSSIQEAVPLAASWNHQRQALRTSANSASCLLNYRASG